MNIKRPEQSYGLFFYAAGVQEGEHLTAVVHCGAQAKVATSRTAFALWCCGGNAVVTWAIQTTVVTAQWKISAEMWSKFRPLITHLPRSWPMDQWLPGAIQKILVTAQQLQISSSTLRFLHHCFHTDPKRGDGPSGNPTVPHHVCRTTNLGMGIKT